MVAQGEARGRRARQFPAPSQAPCTQEPTGPSPAQGGIPGILEVSRLPVLRAPRPVHGFDMVVQQLAAQHPSPESGCQIGNRPPGSISGTPPEGSDMTDAAAQGGDPNREIWYTVFGLGH